jgi:hypothetical protein
LYGLQRTYSKRDEDDAIYPSSKQLVSGAKCTKQISEAQIRNIDYFDYQIKPIKK